MSLLNTTLIRDVEPGIYDVNIRYYKECKPAGRQPYILVEMLIDGLIVTDRWYPNRIPYLMHCLRKQFRMDYFDCTLSQLLDYARTHTVRVSVDYDPRYGRQIDYNFE
jgi:hypothetical protein